MKKTGGAVEKEIPPDLQVKIAAVDPKNSQHLWLKPGIIECLRKRGITHAKTEYQEKLFVTLNGVKKGVFISFTKTPGPGVPGSVVSGAPDAVNEVFTQLKRCVQTPDIMTGFAPTLPPGVAKNIAEYVRPGGKKRTRKASKKLRKTRGRRRTQRGGNVQQLCNEINAAKDIKTAETLYRKGALKFHPDKGGNEEDFKALGNCFDTKKKSLEVPQPANDDEDEHYAAPSPVRSDETGKADMYVYFYRNGERVDFNTLTEFEQMKVRGAVIYSPLEIHGNYGIVKVPISTLKSPVNGSHYSIFTGNISLAFSSEFIGGGRKSRR